MKIETIVTDIARPKPGGASERITDAVIEVVAQCGVSRLTHRRVAAAGGLSLSTTTYHFRTKTEMLDHASKALLDSYVDQFRNLARQCQTGVRPPGTLADLSAQILRNAATRNKTPALAWCEIMLEAARTTDGHSMALDWYAELEKAWTQVAHAFGEGADALQLSSMIDITVGLLFVSRALGLSEAQITAVRNGAQPSLAWDLVSTDRTATRERSKPGTAKSQATRERILEAAIALLIEGGTGAVGYAAVAKRSGEAMTAPAYHFGSISELLRQAQTRMFRASKDRYRKVFESQPSSGTSAETLADVTNTIFIREATQFSAESIAHYSIWLEAARDPDLRPDVASAIGDQTEAWARRLADLFDCREHDAIICQALFVGALVRALATGAPIEHLARLRTQFLWLFDQLGGRNNTSTLFQNLLTRVA